MLPKHESLTVEFKSDLKKYSDSDIFEAVVAFANTDGGCLYLGIENSGEVTGVHDTHKDATTVSAFIANNTVPPVSVRAEIIEDVKPVLKIEIPKSYSGIVATMSGKVLHRRLKANGEPENVAMYPAEFATRLSDLRLLDYSAMLVTSASTNDFAPSEVERLRKLISVYNGDRSLLELNNEDLYKAMGFTREQNGKIYPTISGLLFLGTVSALNRYVPTATAVFQVLEGTSVRVNEDMRMPILALMEKLDNYLNVWNPEQELEIGMFRMSISDYDKRAVREAIVNAFSHRDYTKMGRVRIAISDEGMTIANPGGFVEGVSIDNLLTAEPHGRNPLLADSLKRIGLAERTGRGIDRIFEGSLRYGKPVPDYSASTSVTVSVTIPKSKPDLKLTKLIVDEQNRLGRSLSVNALFVLNTLKDSPKSTVSQLADIIHFSESTIKGILDPYVESGLVEAYGNGKRRTYILSAKAYSTTKEKIGYVHQTDIDETRYLELILNMASASEYIARADVVQLLHVDENKAYKLLKKLVDEGKLEAINKGRYSKYRRV